MIKAIHILPEARAKMEAYVRNCPFEISGLGTIEERGDMLLVTDVFLLEQSGSAGSTTLDPESLSKFVVEMAMAGKDPSQLKFWWHSHVNMGCYWSGTDDKCMDAFKPGDYFIGTVANKKGESRTRLDIYDPIRASVDNIPLITAIDEEMDIAVCLEIKAKVTEEVLPHFVMGTGKWGRSCHPAGQRSRSRPPLLDDSDLLLPEIDLTGLSDDAPLCYSEEEFSNLAKEMGMSFDELLTQEQMELQHGYVF